MTEKSREETLRRRLARATKRGNPVAKNMNKYNKPARHADLTKEQKEAKRFAILRQFDEMIEDD